jgi:transposase-like protein
MTRRPPKLRTPENADRICELLAEGHTLRQIARQLGCEAPAITCWVREDQDKGGAVIALRYAHAREQGCERMADELIEICDADCTVDGKPDNALVQQARLRVDTRKWMLSKMLPKKYGDRVTQEIVGEDGGALVTRIELIPVDPRPRLTEADTASVGEAAAIPLRAITSR